ncbi:carbon-phosphorus lyase subunit PhnH [Vibrio nigripulchritudo]|uniref:phosphonate C-P lyase system protein PhnH n=1 Tax=Vibrio nigripulchritudo TaxID=28173 RepID=UPI00190A12B6|nr:phosphonate C-P lyase system protein PhnH [Vibrio nigripulchritudo]BCL68089.1 carbon-phosphorus lyase subunit PhnH [Vibrio nigripulchritudo]BDU29417.1 carbon-phosphorus lyase subunit PhnH [Vibrio nigripulchritudo]
MKFVKPGFNDPIHDAQCVFRLVLNAVSMPGSTQTMPSDLSFGGANSATTQILLALSDSTTPIWLSENFLEDTELTQNLQFHANTPLTSPAESASFALLDHQQTMNVNDFCWGSAEFPETSTTLLIQVSSLQKGTPLSLQGPGIDGHKNIQVEGIHPDLLAQIQAIHSSQPLGIDVLLTCGCELMALPRTTQITQLNRESSPCT